MNAWRFSAPGKAVLAGEYAVLRGANAIAMAVNRRAVVSLRLRDSGPSVLSAPGLAAGSWRFETGAGAGLRWIDSPPHGGAALVEAAWRATAPEPVGAIDLEIDTREFLASDPPVKLGLGSSAAAAGALTGALQKLAGGTGDLRELAMRVHRDLQKGLGSGVDVATSCTGGVVGFRSGTEAMVQQLDWPEGLAYRFVWTGRSADTTARLRRLEGGRDATRGFHELVDAADRLADTWCEGDAGNLLAEFQRYITALRAFGVDRGLGIFDAGHDSLAQLASAAGVVYKPCGAGGGDIGVGLATDAAALQAFCGLADAAGFHTLSLARDDRGACDEP